EHLQTLAGAVAPEGPGFFYLKIPSEELVRLAEDVLQRSREFFALPPAEKQMLDNSEALWYWVKDAESGAIASIPSTGSGYRGVSKDANFSGDMRESYNLGAPSEILVVSSDTCGMGANPWPDSTTTPSARESWCQTFRLQAAEYFAQCLATCSTLRKKLEDPSCLGPFLLDSLASDRAFERSTSLLGFTHYNYSQFRPAEGYSGSEKTQQRAFGIRPHQDDGLCTLLYTDGQGGLEYAKGLREASSEMSLYSGTHCRADLQFSDAVIWEPVPFLPGHWIVNLGTDLFRWAAQSSSQSALCRPCKATLHRVVPITGTTDRYSMPFFYEPNLDVRDPYPPHTARYEYLIRDAADGVVRKLQEKSGKP
ncbi:unnamed protein product, partial [Symbiodinium sp. CCMP2456]